MNGDKLVPIMVEDIPVLQNMYQCDRHHEIVYYCLQNYIDWLRKDRRLKDFAISSLNDTWRENGTFIIQDRYEIFFHTLDPTNDTLTRALDLVDWDYSWKITAYYPKHRPSMLEIIKKHNLQLIFDVCTETRYMSKEEAQKLEVIIPPELELRPLRKEDAVRANTIWPHRAIGSEFLLKRLAVWNPSVGLFHRRTNEMVAWCFQLQTGAHGALEVPVEHRRKGYGSIVTKAMAKKLATMGLNSYGYVVSDNDASRRMYSKLGFEVIGTMHWTRNVPRKLVEWEC